MAVPNRPTTGAAIESTWGQTVHDGVVAQDLQHGNGNISITAAANASIAVNFPRAFASAPDVVVSFTGAPGGSQKLIARATGITTTGFTLFIYSGDQTAVTASAVTFAWFAIGPRA